MNDSRLNPEVFDAWLAEQPEQNRQLITDVRAAIAVAGHNFMEGIKWGTTGYWLPEVSRRNICYIAPHNSYVRLGFFNGATMPDPDNLLEGTGKKLRHIKVYEITDANRQVLTTYVRASAEHAIVDRDSLSG